MKIHTLKRELLVRRPVEEVFSFFENAGNLARITPSNLRFNILTPLPIDMKAGTLIDYTIRVLGIGVHWRTLITGYDPPYGFTDKQLRGPYTFWHHRHEFIATADGTLIRDKVTYALPFGVIGRLAHALFVKSQLRHIFDFRSSVIREMFGER
jgi:ligand-binding SRPBCC domain-containing protein